MSTTEKITIATVTYDKEYPLLLTQVRSIVKYMDPRFVQEVMWLVNHADGEKQANRFYFEQAASHLLDNGFSVRMVPRSAFGLEDYIRRTSGWRHQQLLKLMACDMVATPHYMVLDTKNFLTKPVDAGVLFRGGKPISFRYNCPPLMARCLDASAAAMGCAVDATQWVLPTATPYILITELVKEMLGSTTVPFVDFFYSDPNITEFFLYFCHLKKKGAIESSYELVPQFYATFFASYPSQPQQIEAVQRYVENPNVFCASFHNKRFVNCPPEFKEYMAQLWSRLGLVTGPGDFESIFGAMAAAH